MALNQFGENVFDLTLRGHPGSFADLNIGSDHLHNPGLWGGKVDGFRPWFWPNLLAESERLDARTEWLSSRLRKPLLEALGLGKEHVGALSREALRFLGGGDPRQTTFVEFVTNSGQGLDRHDLALDDMGLARVAASRIGKWLERLVLGGQDVLVDGPHLVSRFPSLISSHDLEDWNAVAQVGADPEALGLVSTELDDAAYDLRFWLSRPAWYWQRLFEDHRIEEVSDPWSSEPAPYRFCEDVSRFVEPDLAREFTAAVPSTYITRYVVNLEAARAAGATFFADEFGIDRVEYEPAVQFAV